MFKWRCVGVEIGDVFIEPLAGKRRIFKALGIAERADEATFEMLWDVTDIVEFNGLPHARLKSRETGNERIIALQMLAQRDIYMKRL
ncbi:MAG: hypothetical protein ACR2OT_01975 [Parvibaculales bacterium]